MDREFILQGLTARTYADAIREMLALEDIKRVIISVAFVSESGVRLISDHLKRSAKKTIVLAGIRNDITSAQALRYLLQLGVVVYVVDTGSRTLTFHPKIYLVRGKQNARLSIGSANLTLGGMNNNVEAGFILRLNRGDTAGWKFAKRIEKDLEVLPETYPDNIIRLTKNTEIDALLASGRIVDEATALPPRPAASAKPGSADRTPRMKMKIPALRRVVRPVAAGSVAKSSSQAVSVAPTSAATAPTMGVEYELVWISKELERRDLNIPDGDNTAATGSINLDKGQLEGAVDHRHYFRDVVFRDLPWPAVSGQVDLATAEFAIVIKNIHHGTHKLTVRHTTSTTSKSYRQKNAMTRISWGKVKPLIAKEGLLRRHMSLYRDRADTRRFLIEID